MIALTQEKREEKIKRLNKIASWADSYGADHNVMIPALEAKEMAEAYIASLTAMKAPIKLKYSSALPNFVDGTDKVDSYHCLIHADTMHHKTQEEAYAEAEVMCGVLFTAPPVPEIELPDLLDIPDGLDLPSTMAAINWYEMEIKRLNGLGE